MSDQPDRPKYELRELTFAEIFSKVGTALDDPAVRQLAADKFGSTETADLIQAVYRLGKLLDIRFDAKQEAGRAQQEGS